MKILNKIENTIKEVANKTLTLKDKLYMGYGASFACKDKIGNTNKQIEIIANHVDESSENTEEFPSFKIIKTSSIDGLNSLFRKHSMNLDTDELPIQGSKNLLTSGTLYNIINDLQSQINELKNPSPKK